MTKADINIMDELAQAALQTETWFKRIHADPYIQRTENAWTAMVERLGLPFTQEDDLTEAQSGVVNAYVNAAFLYGLHVAHAVQVVSGKPMGVSMAILDRIEGRA